MLRRRSLRALALVSISCAILSTRARGQCPADCETSSPNPAVDGRWSKVYFWNAQVLQGGGTGCGHNPEFSHAALVPVRYRGYVLLWKAKLPDCDNPNVTEAYLLNPELPCDLVEIETDLSSSIFCSGASWDKNGNLVVAGGAPFCGGQTPCPSPGETYRFEPRNLDYPPWFPLEPDPNLPIRYPYITGNPWSGPLLMSIGRYYPTLITLDKTTLATSCGTPSIAGSSQIVLGGPPSLDPGLSNVGAVAWQLLEPGAAQWTRSMVPDAVQIAGYHQPGGPTEPYFKIPGPADPNTPEHVLDTYPRAVQLGEPSPTSTDIRGQIFVANDVDTDTVNPPPNTPGRSWVIKPPQATLQSPPPSTGCFELHRGQGTGGDRFYGTTVILHTLTPRNRVIVFGGSDQNGAAVLSSVEEFIPGTNPTVGAWRAKASMAVSRVFLNAVVLPTGQILIVGGDGFDDLHGGIQSPMPRTVPELYDPGPSPLALGSTRSLFGSCPAVSPDLDDCALQPQPISTPRGYHSLALLLPDGRVLSVGGDGGGGSPYDTCVYPDPRYSGEFYSPPYLFKGIRPTVENAPSRITFGSEFELDSYFSPQSPITCVEKVVLLRPAAQTHHFDNDQRYIELEIVEATFDAGTDTWHLRVKAPDASLGPQGFYMLFVVASTTSCDPAPSLDDLVPSEAHFLRLE